MTDTTAVPHREIHLWGGIECTVNRVGERWFDQTRRSGHADRPDDLDRFAALGFRALRYPALWERIAPTSLDHPDWSWTDERLARLRTLGMDPVLGLLHHGSGPAYTSLVDDEFPTKLARFARLVAERYPWVTNYTPVNEPLTTARFSGLYGHWYPHHHTDRSFVRALLAQARAVVLAMRAIRQVNPSARLIQTEDCGQTFGTRSTGRQVQHEEERRWLTWDLLAGRVGHGHPMRGFLLGAGATERDLAFFLEHSCAPDVLGLNYYLTSDRYLDERLDRYPAAAHGGNGYIRYADVEAVRARPQGIVGHEAHLLAAWERYRLPVAITEVHLACTREEQMRWFMEAWRGAHAARAGGAEVEAVTAWALLGSYDWDSLVTCDAGHYEPGVYDIRSTPPRRTALGSVIAELASGREPQHPVLDMHGWWHRPDRLVHGGRAGLAAASPPGRPLLIIGATGTLGRAFHRICSTRGLASRLTGRLDVDIADASRVDAILRAVRPWAVINAAGYVRVDDAEDDHEACYRSNVTGPVNLAAACHRHGIALVTFSSDLVFNGDTTVPYTEEDAPCPLNVYGATKAEAETRVLDLLADALVIRTSAFFGPWDEYNFITGVLRALGRNEAVRAASDTTVSPTYVPDLVNATLDLLIDGERGIWHLANDGATTWYELARRAATLAGLPLRGICPVPTSQLWGPAARPAYSAIRSSRGALMRGLDAALAAYLVDADESAWRRGADTCVSS
jgi:dTDP-4-dehydrorhamnose reductase